MDEQERGDVARVLRGASNMVLERGLARGIGRDPEGQVCLNGAIVYTAEELGLSGNLAWKALEHVDARVVAMGLPTQPRRDGYGTRISRAVQWSNDWAAGAEQVAEILKLTAEDVELEVGT